MENELSAAQNAAYDYRRCARVWQRVDPTLDPYPDVRAAAAMAADTPGRRSERRRAERRADAPGRAGGPLLHGARRRWSRWRCCRASSARSSPTGGPIFSSRGARRRRRRGRCSAPSRRTRGGTPGRLLAAVYLITGERYCPAICYPPLRCDGYCAALRERYHEEVCGGFNYRRASQETLDPCLQQLLLAFSQDEYRHANAMLCLLSGVM